MITKTCCQESFVQIKKIIYKLVETKIDKNIQKKRGEILKNKIQHVYLCTFK